MVIFICVYSSVEAGSSSENTVLSILFGSVIYSTYHLFGSDIHLWHIYIFPDWHVNWDDISAAHFYGKDQ